MKAPRRFWRAVGSARLAGCLCLTGDDEEVVGLFGDVAKLEVAVDVLDGVAAELEQVLHFVAEGVAQVEVAEVARGHEACGVYLFDDQARGVDLGDRVPQVLTPDVGVVIAAI